MTLRYAVRRGGLSGTGEIRWQPAGDHYRLSLEARIGDLVLLAQESSGGLGEHGLEPDRHTDRRWRRRMEAADFDRAGGRVRYAGPAVVHPLVPGAQDRLSVFLQVAAIAAAAPERMVDGAEIVVAVVGARANSAVWTLRVAGHDAVQTAVGPVDAVRLVRAPQGPADSDVELWLDPARHWLPVRAALRTSSGASEFDLRLDSMSSGS